MKINNVSYLRVDADASEIPIIRSQLISQYAPEVIVIEGVYFIQEALYRPNMVESDLLNKTIKKLSLEDFEKLISK